MMPATNLELAGEPEDEFEEEAAELEPFFFREKRAPVAHSKAIYVGGLDDEFEDDAFELEPLHRGRVQPAQRELELPAWTRWGAQARKTPAPQRPPTKAPAPTLCSASTLGDKNWSTIRISEKVIPPYIGRDGNMKSSDCAVNVPDALKAKTQIDLLVFLHGLDIEQCQPCFDPNPSNTKKKFRLDAQIQGHKRPVAVAVPRLFWKKGDNGANVAGSWTAANFNKFVTAVLGEIGKASGITTTLGSLIIAGHSRAYAILTPLAREFCQGTAAATTPTEPLAKLTEVWAMDSTYSPLDVRALEIWASKLPKARFFVLYSQKAVGGERFHWLNYYSGCPGFGPPSNLTMCVVPEEHCEIPTKYIGELLSATKYPPDWCKSSS
jgi:hypothetical protein